MDLRLKFNASGRDLKKWAVELFSIVIGTFLYMIGTSLFVFPSGLLLGGTSGISVILNNFLPFSPAMILSGLNVLLLLLALIILGREMAAKTLIGSLLTTAFIAAFDLLFPSFEPIIKSPYICSVVGGAIISLASAILFYVNASSGGTDIIALIIKKFSNIKIGKALLITDALIVIVGGILSGLEIAIASVIGLLIKTLGIDLLIRLICRARHNSKKS